MEEFEKVKERLASIEKVIAGGPFHDDWASLSDFTVPAWYQKAKFGIFIHWGAYAVPAFGNEWYPRNMYQQGTPEFEHHRKVYGPQDQFGYRDIIPLFKAEKFDAAAWADLFQQAGARFVVPVAEHHDGFAMYRTDFSHWNAAEMGPKKDILGLLKEEVEKRGMVLGASSHRMEHYWFLSGGLQFDSDIHPNPPYGDLYWPTRPDPFQNGDMQQTRGMQVEEAFMQDWLVRCCELVDRYRPQLLYFDWWIQVEPMKPYLKKLAAYYYNRAQEWGRPAVINYKFDAFGYHTAVPDIERGQLAAISPDYWQCDTSVAKNSWCYTEGNEYKTPRDILCDLCDVCSKNGSLLLNIGPKADGTIPEEDAHILQHIGRWLRENGEGIYDTTHWKVYGEGPTEVKEGHFTDTLRGEFTPQDIRFTSKNGAVYAFVLRWPEDGVVRIHALHSGGMEAKFRGFVRNVTLLATGETLKFEDGEDALIIYGPQGEKEDPVGLKIEVE